MATYLAQMQSDGSLYGECPNSGVVMTSDGAATFRATGCGQMAGDGGAKFRGAVISRPPPSLMSVNGKCMVYERGCGWARKRHMEYLGMDLK